jgi:hypothetical protein
VRYRFGCSDKKEEKNFSNEEIKPPILTKTDTDERNIGINT